MNIAASPRVAVNIVKLPELVQAPAKLGTA
jgi:hypothetical protein